MSPKISSKNLSYNDSLPPFLAALHAQASGTTGPSPLLAAQRRTAKKRSGSEEAEDHPLVVDEDGNVIDIQTDKDGVVTAGSYGNPSSPSREGAEATEGVKDDSKTTEESKTAIGGAAGKKRRRVGKVIGQDDEETTIDVKQKVDQKDDEGKYKEKDDKEASDHKSSNKIKSNKSRAKKIKLSFDDAEG